MKLSAKALAIRADSCGSGLSKLSFTSWESRTGNTPRWLSSTPVAIFSRLCAARGVFGRELPALMTPIWRKKLSSAAKPKDWPTRLASDRLFSSPYWVWKNSGSRPTRPNCWTSRSPTALSASRSIFRVAVAV